MIKEKFARLKNVCDHILKCQIKVANIADRRKAKTHFSYMVSINITMPEGFDLYTLRLPQSQICDSIEQAIANVFVMM